MHHSTSISLIVPGLASSLGSGYCVGIGDGNHRSGIKNGGIGGVAVGGTGVCVVGGFIDRETAKRRLVYLVALNRANGWMSEESLKRLVASALEDLGIEVKRGELGRYMRRRAVAVTV